MKLTDKLVEKFGNDKLLHFSIGGWITSLLSPLGMLYTVGAALSIIILNIIKEYIFDTKVDWKDITATAIGGGLSIVLLTLINLIFK